MAWNHAKSGDIFWVWLRIGIGKRFVRKNEISECYTKRVTNSDAQAYLKYYRI